MPVLSPGPGLTGCVPAERTEAMALIGKMDDPVVGEKDKVLARLGILLSHADTYDPVPFVDEAFHSQYEVFRGVWDEACELRRKGVLTGMAHAIRCPVVAIHGDYDPHPAQGVDEPLSRECPDFRFILLSKVRAPSMDRTKRIGCFLRSAGEGDLIL